MPMCLSNLSRRSAAGAVVCAAALLGGTTTVVSAQATDSTRARPDSTVRTPSPAGPIATPAVRGRFTPPLTPRRAFLYSAMLPGLGQSRLDRGSSGALFAAVELSALVMVRRSAAGLREARRFRNDTVFTSFAVGPDGKIIVGPDGKPQGTGPIVGRYDADLVRTRRLHVEDWLAVIAFNHLFAGADAFVSAQLWDIPLQVSAAPSMNGPLFVATLRF